MKINKAVQGCHIGSRKRSAMEDGAEDHDLAAAIAESQEPVGDEERDLSLAIEASLRESRGEVAHAPVLAPVFTPLATLA